MNSDAKRKLENQLMVMGLGGLSDPNLIQQFAMIINMYGEKLGGHHAFFGKMLASCDPDKRTAMYEALRPHLMFDPKPLDSYIADIKEQASRNIPIVVGQEQFEQVDQPDATGAIAEFNCYRCTAFNRYLGETFVDAVVMGRNEGWVRDLVRQKEVCPKCAKKFVN